VAKADANNADAGVGDGLAREVNKGCDPRVVFEGRVFGTCDQHGVNGVEVRVGGEVVDHIVA